MKLEVGKYYKTRDGRKAGPIGILHHLFSGPVEGDFPSKGDRVWRPSGVHEFNDSTIDLVAEWEDPMKITMDGKYAYRKDPYTQVRILCVDGNHPNFPVVTLCANGYTTLHQASGKTSTISNNEYDLVPLQVKLPDLWVNIYDDGSYCGFFKNEYVARNYCEDTGKTVKYIPAPPETS